jgi:hypothetical protein
MLRHIDRESEEQLLLILERLFALHNAMSLVQSPFTAIFSGLCNKHKVEQFCFGCRLAICYTNTLNVIFEKQSVSSEVPLKQQ